MPSGGGIAATKRPKADGVEPPDLDVDRRAAAIADAHRPGLGTDWPASA